MRGLQDEVWRTAVLPFTDLHARHGCADIHLSDFVVLRLHHFFEEGRLTHLWKSCISSSSARTGASEWTMPRPAVLESSTAAPISMYDGITALPMLK